MEEDTRNVTDQYKGMTVEAIKADLSTKRIGLEIAVENLERDFNMGTIVRTANAFNVAAVHIIGRRQWNKRGAMKTDAYMDLIYHSDVSTFLRCATEERRTVVAIDNVPGSKPLSGSALPERVIMVFGSESSGLSQELLTGARVIVSIEQSGSTRSLNVGVAAGIAMYAWVQRFLLSK